MLIAQTSSTVPIEVIVNPILDAPTNLWQIIIGLGTLVAALIAVLASLWIGRAQIQQGRRLQRLEEREHEWIEEDRGAWIEVTAHLVNTTEGSSGEGSHFGVRHDVHRYVRLKNTGRRHALSVSVKQLPYRGESQEEMERNREAMPDLFYPHVPTEFDIIHPGEWVDLPLVELTFGSPSEVFFPVVGVDWHDPEFGNRSNLRRLTRY